MNNERFRFFSLSFPAGISIHVLKNYLLQLSPYKNERRKKRVKNAGATDLESIKFDCFYGSLRATIRHKLFI